MGRDVAQCERPVEFADKIGRLATSGQQDGISTRGPVLVENGGSELQRSGQSNRLPPTLITTGPSMSSKLSVRLGGRSHPGYARWRARARRGAPGT